MNLKRITLFLFVLTLPLFGNFTSIAEEDLLGLGDHFSKLENYDAAITEYKRFLFFHPGDTRAAAVYQKIGLAYRAQELWQEAISMMRNAVSHALSEQEKSKYQLELAVTLIASQNYDLARLELIRLTIRNPSGAVYQRALFLQAVAYLYQFQWEEAREALRHYTTDEMLDILFDKAVNLPQKSPKVAKVLSIILPGTGQIYAGNWRGGLNALALNGAFGFVAVNSVLDRHYVDAVSWTYFIFQRYYLGNLYRAEKTVREFNEDKSRRAASNILQRLQEIVESTGK
jgi:tetratricopeptide (TPR) repeat protein